MARIPTYSTDANISASDKLLGTDADNANATKNFTVGELKTFVNANVAGTVNTIPIFTGTGTLGDSKLSFDGNNSLVVEASTKLRGNWIETTGALALNGTAGFSGQVATSNASIAEWAYIDTILGYKSYSAKWTQQGTAAPVVTELQNNTGVTFTWARSQTGTYVVTASSAVLLSDKTFVNIQGSAYSSPPLDKSIIVQPSLLENNATTLNYRAIETDTTTLVDGNSGWIEIRIYN
tara:strand:+ start:311 stop:1018 length:708 start_codon:yes stop_codon:yes gene_type:complete